MIRSQQPIVYLQMQRATQLQKLTLIVHLGANPEITFYLQQPLLKFRINLVNMFHVEHC